MTEQDPDARKVPIGDRHAFSARHNRRLMPRIVLGMSIAATLALLGCASREVVIDTASTSAPTTAQPTDDVSAALPSAGLNNTLPGSCQGTIGAAAVEEVDVPAGATCILEGTIVGGNVTIEAGATLVARNVSVNGDVQAEGALVVEVTGASTIGGNFQIEDGGSSKVTNTRIDGDLKWESQSGPLEARGNTIGGNLQADENGGGLTLAANNVGGDLQCDENVPPPGGGGNTTVGASEDQCAHF